MEVTSVKVSGAKRVCTRSRTVSILAKSGEAKSSCLKNTIVNMVSTKARWTPTITLTFLRIVVTVSIKTDCPH